MMTDQDFKREADVVTEPFQPGTTSARRQAAFARLRAAAIDAREDRSWLPDYKNLLRRLTTDPDLILRHASVSELAMLRDLDVQNRLRAGLFSDGPALVPAAWALQLLAYDSHIDDIGRCRALAHDRQTDRSLRIEALRILARDAESENQLAGIMTDTTEPADIRLWAGMALRALAPATFAKLAKGIVAASLEPTSLELRNMCHVALETSPTLRSLG